MKKVTLVTMLVVLAIIALLTACSTPAQEPTQATVTVTVEKTAEPAKTVEVNASTWSSSGYAYTGLVYMADAIEESTGGRFKFTLMPADTVTPQAEHLNALGDGVFDVSFLWEGWFAEQAPALAVFGNIEGYLLKGPEDVWALWNRGHKDVRVKVYQEFNAVPFGVSGYAANGIFSNKPLDHPESLKGQKIASGGSGAQAAEFFGASAVDLSLEELFSGMTSGMVDGGMDANVTTWKELGLMDVTKYWLVPETIAAGNMAMVANADFWNSLTEADRHLFHNCYQWAQARQRYEIEVETVEVLKEAEAKGITINRWTEDERKQWRQAILDNAVMYDDPLFQEAYDIMTDYCEEMGYL